MSLGNNKSLFAADSEVKDVKNAEMIRSKDARERDEFARRLLEKDKEGKSKTVKNPRGGITLS